MAKLETDRNATGNHRELLVFSEGKRQIKMPRKQDSEREDGSPLDWMVQVLD